ncbi:hypothetical protein DL95DRAFT_104182 [Leptodontidium sp. 2 PMI_412]|nr:hypothetical protein DL95DRAFT_104182 [Leptodontidium sp. 2 PMI_412]
MGSFRWEGLYGEVYMGRLMWGDLHGEVYMGAVHGDLCIRSCARGVVHAVLLCVERRCLMKLERRILSRRFSSFR